VNNENERDYRHAYPIVSECMICGKGKVVEKEEKNHVTYVAGIKMVLPEAIVGRCDTCGAVNYALRKESIKGGSHAED